MDIQQDFSLANEGVRQGDPHSPLLFCLAEDVLSRSISLLVNSGQLKPMSGPGSRPPPTHVLYADDIMVFCKGTKKNLTVLIMSLFQDHGSASGQYIILEKCKFFIGSISNTRQLDI